VGTGIDYYERRAGEYNATSWKRVDADGRVAEVVRSALDSLAPMDTLDVGCGTGYVSGWLPGRITLLDSSPAMLAIASRCSPFTSVPRWRVWSRLHIQLLRPSRLAGSSTPGFRDASSLARDSCTRPARDVRDLR